MGTEREDFTAATEFYRTIISQVQADQWALPARGSLTVQEVAAQGSRPLTTTRDFLLAGAQHEDITTTVGYFVRDQPVDEETRAGIQRRGREALERFQQHDPIILVTKLVDEARAAVDRAPDDALVGTQFGGMRLLAYLPTRTLELVTCSIEISDAIGSGSTPGTQVLGATAQLLTNIAIARGKGPLLVKTIWTQVQLA